ncbi:hypothetical protein NKJ09_30580 [Mesorhizobium sp. M0189]|uniref:hypothetical protein n=1 Tax=Mesorhizobium sp. M0189 TaxID=2956909 RepID=UPI0033380F58
MLGFRAAKQAGFDTVQRTIVSLTSVDADGHVLRALQSRRERQAALQAVQAICCKLERVCLYHNTQVYTDRTLLSLAEEPLGGDKIQESVGTDTANASRTGLRLTPSLRDK